MNRREPCWFCFSFHHRKVIPPVDAVIGEVLSVRTKLKAVRVEEYAPIVSWVSSGAIYPFEKSMQSGIHPSFRHTWTITRLVLGVGLKYIRDLLVHSQDWIAYGWYVRSVLPGEPWRLTASLFSGLNYSKVNRMCLNFKSVFNSRSRIGRIFKSKIWVCNSCYSWCSKQNETRG